MTRVAVVIGSASPPTGSGEPALPPSDRGALALALARFPGELRAYSADPEARWFALAAGVAAVEALSGLRIGDFDVALVGRGGCAERGDGLPAQLAEDAGAALVYEVVDVRREADRLLVTRDLGRGARDLVSVRGRAVLVLGEDVERGAYVSRHRVNAARAAGGAARAPRAQERIEWEPAAPRVRLGDHAARVAGSACERRNALFGMGGAAECAASLLRGSAQECARQLLRYLSHHGFVARGLEDGWQGAQAQAAGPQPARGSRARRAADPAALSARVRRRPRALPARGPVPRGPGEIGVDVR